MKIPYPVLMGYDSSTKFLTIYYSGKPFEDGYRCEVTTKDGVDVWVYNGSWNKLSK